MMATTNTKLTLRVIEDKLFSITFNKQCKYKATVLYYSLPITLLTCPVHKTASHEVPGNL